MENNNFVWWRINAFCDRKTPKGLAEILPIMREVVNRMDDDQIVLLFSVLCSNSTYQLEDLQEAVMPLLEDVYMKWRGESPHGDEK